MATETIQKCEATPLAQGERIRGGRAYVPAVDIVEQPDKLLLRADVPGVARDDVEITYERGQLSIHGRVTRPENPPDAACVQREYGVGDFYRTFAVGEAIDSARIEAELKDGVLTLHLPKAAALLPRKIALKGG